MEFEATANSWALNKLKDQLTEMFLIGVIQLNPKSGKSTATSLTLPLTTVVELLGDTDGLKWTQITGIVNASLRQDCNSHFSER